MVLVGMFHYYFLAKGQSAVFVASRNREAVSLTS